MSLADHAKKFGILYLAGAFVIGCAMVSVALLSQRRVQEPPLRGSDTRVASRMGADTDKCGESTASPNGEPQAETNASADSGTSATPKKVQLWEDGPYWADRNIGTEEPWEYGYYFWWGDTVGYTCENNVWMASDGSATGYLFGELNPPTNGKDIPGLKREGWVTQDGVLAPEHDAAQVQWGEDWCMPTDQELKDLNDKCDWTRTTMNGVCGYVVRGRGAYASASIFLPAVGIGFGTVLCDAGSRGGYWSSVPDWDSDKSWALGLSSGDHDVTHPGSRFMGLPVRPVQKTAKLSKRKRFAGGKETGESMSLNSASRKSARQNKQNVTRSLQPCDIAKKVQLWEGGPYWADRNIGAEEPWEYGYYFWWGSTVGYKRENQAWVTRDGSLLLLKSGVAPRFGNDLSDLLREGWITGDKVLAPAHDAAHVQWGGDWRMPTDQELKDLNNKCDWTWTTMNGVKGYAVRGRGAYDSASIFLPATGLDLEDRGPPSDPYGQYWSSVPRSKDVYHSGYGNFEVPHNLSPGGLDFDSGRHGTFVHRVGMQSIRPVQGNIQMLKWLSGDDGWGNKSKEAYSRTNTVLNCKKVQLWEDGPYWADRNIGAEEPWNCGSYFWWGDTVGEKRERKLPAMARDISESGSSREKEEKEKGTPIDFKNLSDLLRMGWITADHVLTPEHDAAHVQWGGDWRMPTDQELDDLSEKCDWIWTSTNGVNGYVVRGRGAFASASIFLPTTDDESDSMAPLFSGGSGGSYWSSVPRSDGTCDTLYCCRAWYLSFSNDQGMIGASRYCKFPVRPVHGAPKFAKQKSSHGGKKTVERITLEHKKVRLWEDGPYWADTNVGAEEPWEFGYYFWWGDTVGYTRKNDAWVASDGSASDFSFEERNAPTSRKESSALSREGWVTADNVLVPEHDAAHMQWGGDWRMPTRQEFEDLKSKCDWSRTTLNGVKGFIVRGRGDYASSSIFLPAAGCGDGTLLGDAGLCGSYWSSHGTFSWVLYSREHFWYNTYEYYGRSVRPVQGIAKLSKQKSADREKETGATVSKRKIADREKATDATVSKQKSSDDKKKTGERIAADHKKVKLWEDGPYWADRNIGAEEPWEYGYYFWWGDTVGYKRANDAWVASDGSSLNFIFEGKSAPTCGKFPPNLQSEGWISAEGVLLPEHDAAHVQWGGEWRMPTGEELSALCEKCDWTRTTMNGVNGYVVRGRGDYASASIFLPAAGYGNVASLDYGGSYGYYWSSAPIAGNSMLSSFLGFNSSQLISVLFRYGGHSIRPVQGIAK